MNYNQIPVIVIDDFDALSLTDKSSESQSESEEASSLVVSPSTLVEEMDRLKSIISVIVPCLNKEDAAGKPPPPVVVKTCEKNKVIRFRASYCSKDFARIYLMHQLKFHCEENRCLNKFLFTKASRESLGLSVLPLVKPRGCVHYTPTEEDISRFLHASGRLPMQPQTHQPLSKPAGK